MNPSIFDEVPPPLNSTNQPTEHEFYFHGTGSEYFKIWIVNLVLIIVTLGFYSPWAKVRRLRYFYGNTELNGEVFDYTASPKRILIGRLVALSLYVIISVIAEISPDLAVLGSAIIFLVMPWLMRSTMRFMARNSQYNNIRFGFYGKLSTAYLIMLASVVMSVVSFGLLMPVAWWLFKRYQFDNTYFGELKFNFNASIWDMYKAMIIPILIFIGACVAGVLLLGLSFTTGETNGIIIIFAVLGFYFVLLLIMPLMQAYTHKAIWQSMTLGENEFNLDNFNPLTFAFIQATNYICTVLTLGLFLPWAKVRLHRYKIETLSLIAYDDFDALTTPHMHDESSIADEINDVFDFDLSW
ncbi:MAG: YjgN family protein [Moraxella sp.]|uniref:YjgN family protein n=1 Tax=Moraxella sp. TaxID=479 RepID=UPI0026DCFBC2|nr:YjgN family protein [Moraxella sp.]MDO4450685.1 YjgN family protein [Moraxella sp.]